jgi:hypothetical protein
MTKLQEGATDATCPKRPAFGTDRFAPTLRRPALGNPTEVPRKRSGSALAAATAGGLEPLLGSSCSLAQANNDRGESKGDERAEEDAEIRIEARKAERRVSIPPHNQRRQVCHQHQGPSATQPRPGEFKVHRSLYKA